MLRLLHIENIAVIEQADILFERGFNVMTGETGAGKSIVIDAISAILGERAYRDMIRTGAARAAVRAIFDDVPELAWFAENSVPYDTEVVVQREIYLDGKNLCRVNGVAVTVADDAAVSGRVVEDRGQHGGAVAALLVERHELLQRDGVEQWHVGRGDQHRAMQVAFLGQLRHRALDRAAGAGDVVLVDDVDVRVVGPCRLGDAVGLIVHDDGQRLGLQMSD